MWPLPTKSGKTRQRKLGVIQGKSHSTIKFSIFSFPRNSTLWYLFYICADFYTIKINISIRKRDFKITSLFRLYQFSFRISRGYPRSVFYAEKRRVWLARCLTHSDWLMPLWRLFGWVVRGENRDPIHIALWAYTGKYFPTGLRVKNGKRKIHDNKTLIMRDLGNL